MGNRYFEYFLAIEEFQSVTKAAEVLFISQPSLSQYLRKLENELGTKLFKRYKNKMILTYAGERYKEYIFKSQELENQLKREVATDYYAKTYTLKLGAPIWSGSMVFPEVIPRILGQYPNIKLQLFELGSYRLTNQLINKRVDIILIHEHPDIPKIEAEVLFADQLSLVMSRHHKLIVSSKKKTSKEYPLRISAEDLNNELLVQTDQDLIITKVMNEYMKRNNVMPEKSIVAKNIVTVLNLVAMGAGFSFLPNQIIEQSIYKDQLAYAKISDEEIDWDLKIAINPYSANVPVVQDAYNIIRTYYSNA